MENKKYKLLTVVGARPQFIKAAPLSKAIMESENLKEVMVHTGQHYDYALSQQFFDELGLPRGAALMNCGRAPTTVRSLYFLFSKN